MNRTLSGTKPTNRSKKRSGSSRQRSKKPQWKTLVHNGVCFPPEYEPRGFRIRIRGKSVVLTPFQEEMAVAWVKKRGTPYVEDPVFQDNFLKDFLKLFPAEFRDVKIPDIDWSEIENHLEREKALLEDKEFRKERARRRKELREKLKARYGWAEVDGERFEVANYMVEPPGIFMGRGDHPMRGRWKPRIHPQDVTLNLGESAPVPPGPWKEVLHDRTSIWLARWVDRLTGKEKYVWLTDSAPLRQQRDRLKYDHAARLGRHIERVTRQIIRGMSARQPKKRMVATTAYLIYKLAMRVGDEKDPDEADTVGASTLRVEHVKIRNKSVDFDFLGKDSVRWEKTLTPGGPERAVIDNLRRFVRGKRPTDLIFSGISSRTVNEFLGGILEGLTAKVFRTYLATRTVVESLRQVDPKAAEGSEQLKLFHAKMANLQAAVLCNHKRAIPKTFERSLARKKERLQKLEERVPKTEKQAARLELQKEKVRLQIELAQKTRDYNLGTSLRNYIDPRVTKAWCDHVGLDWMKLYTKALQRKFAWARRSRLRWKKIESGWLIGP